MPAAQPVRLSDPHLAIRTGVECNDVFIREKVYRSFAEAYLDPNQIDEVVLADLPGYEDPNDVPDSEAA